MTPGPDGPDALPRRAGLSGGLLTLLFVVVVAIGAIVSVVGGGPPVADVGSPAPNIAFEDFDGVQFDLAEHVRTTRQPVILNLWASWCGPCREEFPLLSEFAVARGDISVVAVAVQQPNLDDALAFVEEMSPAFTVGWDRDGAIRESYPSFGLPATFAINTSGDVTAIELRQLSPESLEELAASATR